MNDEMVKMYREIHENKPGYGNGASFLARIHALLLENNIETAIDFGCGKGSLTQRINMRQKIKCFPYDPGVLEFAVMPMMKDAVICNDVMEHCVDEDDATDTLLTIKALAERFVWFNISCREAKEILPDGRNAHTLVRPPCYWTKFIMNVFQGFVPIEYSYHVRNKHINFALVKDNDNSRSLSPFS